MKRMDAPAGLLDNRSDPDARAVLHDWHEAQGRRAPRTMVAIVVAPHELVREAERLATCLRSHGVSLVAIGEEGPQIQATHDPFNRLAVISLYGVDDGTWPDSKNGARS